MRGDIAPRPIGWTALAIAATVAGVIGAVFLLLHLWDLPSSASRVDLPDAVPVPGPVLQPAPQLDLAQYRADKQEQLDSVGWVDARSGIAHIPITAAMQMLAASAPRPQEAQR